jgi:hypothetical protein
MEKNWSTRLLVKTLRIMAKASKLSFKLFLHTINSRVRVGLTAIEKAFFISVLAIDPRARESSPSDVSKLA